MKTWNYTWRILEIVCNKLSSILECLCAWTSSRKKPPVSDHSVFAFWVVAYGRFNSKSLGDWWHAKKLKLSASVFFFLIIILFLAGSYLDFKICFCPFSFFLSSSSPVFFLSFFFFYVQTRLANQCLLRFLQIYFPFNKTGYSTCFTYVNFEHIIFSNSFGSDWNIENVVSQMHFWYYL